MNKDEQFIILEKLNTASQCLSQLQNSLNVIMQTNDESCEHNILNAAQNEIFSVMAKLAKH